MMPVVTTIAELHAMLQPWRRAGESIGFVPTMGALHKGHMKLVETSKKTMQRTVAYIFVNPMQFGPSEDLGKYPKQLEADKQLLAEAGCDLLYAPTADEIYPSGFVTKVSPGPLSKILEGAVRPGHFTGVATVVTKMLLQTMPKAAFFGEKDYQQLLVIRRVVRDLNIPVEIVGVPTMRDHDGLALSSRNAYLTPADRALAAAFPQIMNETVAQVLKGAPIEDCLTAGRSNLVKKGFALDYLELTDTETLKPLIDLTLPARLLGAVRLGTTRLIDNMAVI